MTPFVRLSDKRMKGVIILKKRILPFVLLFAMLLSTQAFAAAYAGPKLHLDRW